ncbi:Ribonuclease H-like domain containing protein [Trema orientale]|uniref:Ribonuclease H-like domain containing protein n=1 Tax=Trema orientale TaxID=63057 RepID=A0A2P5B045_TREOI|nr:Ribonuclease H-like domain containing protein [Trema orientale]
MISSLPTTFNLRRRKICISHVCLICHNGVESSFHALVRCDAAEAVWEESKFWELFASFRGGCITELFLFLREKLCKSDFELCCVIFWFIWYNRNQILHGGVTKEPSAILEDASLRRNEFCASLSSMEVKVLDYEVPRNYKWKPPEAGLLKLNIDAAVVKGYTYVGVGAVVRDHWGPIVAAVATRLVGSFGVFIAECLALREGLQFCLASNLEVNVVETDALNVASAVLSYSPLSEESSILADISLLLRRFRNASVHHIPPTR